MPLPSFVGLLIALFLLGSQVVAQDSSDFRVEVNILRADVKAGTATITTVPRGTVLTAHEFNGSYYLIDLPSAESQSQGWIAKDDVHRVVNDYAEFVQRISALPAEQQDAAEQQAFAEVGELKPMEEKLQQLLQQGHAEDANKLAQQFAGRLKNLLGEHNQFYAVALYYLGLSERDLGHYAEARNDMSAALGINLDLFGPKHGRVADTLTALGDIAYRSADYPTAKKYDERALKIRLEVFGEKDVAVAESLNDLGSLADAAGDYAAARSLYEKALAIKRTVLGEKSRSTASTLQNLALVATETGDFSTAIADFNAALAIEYETLGVVHPETATTLNNMGRLAWRAGDMAQAAKYFTIALKVQRALHGEKHPSVAHELHNLGVLAEESGDYATAQKYLEQALAIRLDTLGDKHPDVADSLNSLGAVSTDRGDFQVALRYYDRALSCYQQIYGENHPTVASVLVNIANCRAASGDWAGAIESTQQSRQIARRYVAHALPGLPENEQIFFLCMHDAWRLQSGLSLAVAHPADQRLAIASAGWLLNGKAVTEEAISAQTRSLRNADSPAAATLARQLMSVRSDLASLSMQPTAPASQAAKQAELQKLIRDEESLSRQLAGIGTEVQAADPWVSIDDLQPSRCRRTRSSSISPEYTCARSKRARKAILGQNRVTLPGSCRRRAKAKSTLSIWVWPSRLKRRLTTRVARFNCIAAHRLSKAFSSPTCRAKGETGKRRSPRWPTWFGDRSNGD